MRVRTSLAAAALVLTLSACSGLSTSYDFDPTANFTGYQSWAWMDMQPNPQLSDMQVNRGKSAIEDALTAKGMQRVRGEPDFWVGFQVILDEEVSYNTVNSYYGGGWGYGGWYGPGYGGMTMGTSRTYETRVQVGTLVIDIFDNETKQLVWRGTGESKIQEISDPQERQARLDAAVRKIMETFPPSTN
jgi:hypothetical protein